MKEKVVEVKKYTRPGDEDSADGIRSAIAEAIDSGAATVLFEKGTYYLSSYVILETEHMMHDADSAVITDKKVHIPVKKSSGLKLKGSDTILAGSNDGRLHDYLPSILWCEDNKNLSLEDISFTRFPEYGSSGEVVEKNDDSIIIEVPKDNTISDHMGTHCMNLFDKDGNLKGVSLSYGPGLGKTFDRVGERKLSISDKVLKRAEVGDYISWHQGAKTDFQLFFYNCNDLRLNNIRTFNSNGFAILAESCRNITADRVEFRPRSTQRFVAPRDAWKLFKCTGNIRISRMYVEGVRMDGQNVQSNFVVVRSILNEKKIVVFCKYTKKEIEEQSEIEFYNEGNKETRKMLTGRVIAREENGHLYEIELLDNIPEYVSEGCICSMKCWEPDSYTCTDSEFRNVAGAGHLLRVDHVTIANCKYENTMNSGIMLGAEMPVHNEGGHATDINICGCTFINSGFTGRYETSEAAAIGIDSAGFSEPCNRNISIRDNHFFNCERAIFIRDAIGVNISNNTYKEVKEHCKIDPGTTEEITVED